MDVSSFLESQAPAEHLVRHDAPQVLTEKPNMSKPGVREDTFLTLQSFAHGTIICSLVCTLSLQLGKGKCAPLPEQPDQLNYFLPVLPKLERRENHKTNVSSAEPILDYILPPR